MIGITIAGRETFLDLQIESRRLDATLRTAVRDLAKDYNAKLLAELRRPKGGKLYGANKGRRTYRRQRVKATVFGRKVSYSTVVKQTRPTIAYRASAPGEAPAVQTGTEARAVRIKFPAKGKGYSARIYADRGTAFYRHFLEFGTAPRVQRRQGGKVVNRYVGRIAPRPVFSPLQAQMQLELGARVQRALDLFVAFKG